MTDDIFDITMPLTLTLAGGQQPAAEARIEVRTAPNQPALGEPWKKVGDISQTVDVNGQMVLIASLGVAAKLNADTYRRAGGLCASWLLKHPAARIDLPVEQFSALPHSNALQSFLEGLRLGSFRYDRHKNKETKHSEIIIQLRGDLPDGEALVRKVTALTYASGLARDWGHEPANIINPLTLSERARSLAQRYGLKVKILDDQALREMGAGAILAVGQGSKTPSRMIVLEYDGTQVDQQPVVLVGKAITFDTGGYSLKSVDSIKGMKYDKMGGIAVLATMTAVAELKLETPVIGIVCAAENAISEEAYRPDDILTSLSGKTIEIITTDAEGRLVLADGLTYAQKEYKPRALIDLATLTGGIVTALGRVRAGLMSNNQELTDTLIRAGDQTYERLWPLPLDDEYFEYIKGDDADLKNSGGREGHPIMGGIFLKQFVSDAVPWAHIDIAGAADTNKDAPYSIKGPTGFGVRLIMEYLENLG